MTKRNKSLDIMKFIGMCCLFLAHVQGPVVLEEIRGFDVPMLVIISGVLAESSIKRISSTKKYILNRIKRLVIPTWTFLTIFYIAMILIGQKPKIMDIVKSYLFQRDCGLAGGVWIIWVYLVCAISAPILYKCISKRMFLLKAFMFLIIYEIIICTMPGLVDIRIFYYTVCTIIPYGVMYSVGMIIPKLNRRTRWILCGCIVSVHIIIMMLFGSKSGGYVSISQFKYPARMYYLSYGCSITIILIELLEHIEKYIPDFRIIKFVSEHSLWIYLWQIMMLTIVNYVLKISEYWLMSWIFLMIGSIFVVLVQEVLVDKLMKKTGWSIWKYFKH